MPVRKPVLEKFILTGGNGTFDTDAARIDGLAIVTSPTLSAELTHDLLVGVTTFFQAHDHLVLRIELCSNPPRQSH